MMLKYYFIFISILFSLSLFSQDLEEYSLNKILESANNNIRKIRNKNLKFKHIGNYLRVDMNTFEGKKEGEDKKTLLYKCINQEHTYKIIFNNGLTEQYEWLCFDTTNYVIILGKVDSIEYPNSNSFAIHFKDENENFYIELNTSVPFESKNIYKISYLNAVYYPTHNIRLSEHTIISYSKILTMIGGIQEFIGLMYSDRMPKLPLSLNFNELIFYLKDKRYYYYFRGLTGCRYKENVPIWVFPKPCKY